jgi:hypothetical protein
MLPTSLLIIRGSTRGYRERRSFCPPKRVFSKTLLDINIILNWSRKSLLCQEVTSLTSILSRVTQPSSNNLRRFLKLISNRKERKSTTLEWEGQLRMITLVVTNEDALQHLPSRILVLTAFHFTKIKSGSWETHFILAILPQSIVQTLNRIRMICFHPYQSRLIV